MSCSTGAQDDAAWHEVYDGFADAQAQGVVRAASVCRSVEDPDDVLVTHDFDDEATARAFFASEGLEDAMVRAGVVVPPQLVWFGELG